VRALKSLPAHCIFHKQDWFRTRKYQGAAPSEKQSFLNSAADRYFKGRPYLHHECYIVLTKPAPNKKAATSVLSNLIKPALVPEQLLSRDALVTWENQASQFVRLMQEAGISMH